MDQALSEPRAAVVVGRGQTLIHASEWLLLAYFASRVVMPQSPGVVLTATPYGRSHYAADGLAGVAVSSLAFVAVEALSSNG